MKLSSKIGKYLTYGDAIGAVGCAVLIAFFFDDELLKYLGIDFDHRRSNSKVSVYILSAVFLTIVWIYRRSTSKGSGEN